MNKENLLAEVLKQLTIAASIGLNVLLLHLAGHLLIGNEDWALDVALAACIAVVVWTER